jgi:hypothetical protein
LRDEAGDEAVNALRPSEPRSMRLEFRFSISPFPSFYSTVRLFALSLRHLGPPYDSARIVVSVGDCATLDDIRAANAWSTKFPVEWRAVNANLFRDHSYLATHNDRYFAPAESDIIVMCDSDVCLVDRVDDLVARIGEPGRRQIAGVQAHFAPFQLGPAANEGEWKRIFAAADLAAPSLTVAYSDDYDVAMGRAPPYLNYGFVAMSRAAFEAIAPLQASYCDMSRRLTRDSFFLTQVALSLLAVATESEVELLSHAYNCSNDDAPFRGARRSRIAGPEEIRVIHYLRGDQMDRRTFLVDPVAHAAFMTADDLNRVNRRLRDHLAMLARHDDLLFR